MRRLRLDPTLIMLTMIIIIELRQIMKLHRILRRLDAELDHEIEELMNTGQ